MNAFPLGIIVAFGGAYLVGGIVHLLFPNLEPVIVTWIGILAGIGIGYLFSPKP